MRDRLEELHLRAQDFSEAHRETIKPSSVGGDNDDSVAAVHQTAVVFEEEPIIENFLSEVKHIRDDITVLDTEVLKFGQQQKTLVATMRQFSVMKKESRITQDIKLKAESLHRRLGTLSKEVQKTEDQQGPSSVTARIERCQHAALHSKFQQEGCKHFISRQLEVSGRNMTEDEVNEMVASGKWEVFNENLLNDAKITRSQLSEIEQRHKVRKELLSLENNMNELRNLFMDIFMLVEEHGASIEHIQTNVESTQDYVAVSNEKFKMAARYKKNNPLRQLCCCCCPPWRCCL
ncbi:syntaxin-19 isoform X3 [Pseudoliparis swirei]|uniref:syntaxin-19 isoform X3 n=1 Tax=Pseudoliparis swirei TaxID=2059687 RepID=UPI0024BE7B74|nr:syntaxin-19 isoform X3 [Pseudoliparis swirei]